MQTQNPEREQQASPAPIEWRQGLPAGAEIQYVAFVPVADAAQTKLMEFKEPRSCQAILVPDAAAQPLAGLTMLLVPANDLEDSELIAKVWSWVEPEVPQERRRGFLMMLWGARVIWAPGRAALLAAPERLNALRHAVVDFSFYEGETRKIEAELAEVWPHLEADTPLAFSFDAQAMSRRDELARRYQQVVDMRARLARIDPAMQHPPVHPPTIGNQLIVRLQERARLSERIEFVNGQLDVLEDVYELCSHRSSEFVLAQRAARLEWMVIILLATETVALIIDLLAANRI